MFLDIDPLIRLYCERHSTQPSESIVDIEKSTHLHAADPRMVSDHIQGRLLSLLSKLLTPDLIVEIGTYTAYATSCLAEGLSQNGKIITIEKNRYLERLINSHLAKTNISNQVDVRYGYALDIIKDIEEPIDLVFIDAAKKEYRDYFDILLPKIRSGGMILADNTLWKAKVLDSKKDKITQAIHQFNEYVSQHDNVEAVLLPYRDGITLIRKNRASQIIS